jgi:cytochrome c oxidase assembly factor CtaG
MQSWDLDHKVLWLLPLVALVYGYGAIRVPPQTSEHFPLWRLISFNAGLIVVFLAIASPLEALGERLLYLHMTQHMLLMMVAPPLIWLGQPLVPMLRVIPPRLIRLVVGLSPTSSALRALGRIATHPLLGWIALTTSLVAWHLPQCYELALHSERWHHIQHACFVASALWFWWPVIAVWPGYHRWPQWAMIPYLVSADLVNTVLSAILSFSTHALYPSYGSAPRLMGLSPLDDQALAGAIMWVPGSIAFLLPAVLLTAQLCDPIRRSGSVRIGHGYSRR